MKANILNINGEKIKEMNLPSCFSQQVREDIVYKVLETKKTGQPYSPSPVAGKQHSASGVIRHRRHVWKSSYGRGMSRIPRKIFSRRGTQFNWEGAEIASTKGGRRAHPPKVLSRINTLKINKKELKTALISALSATADKKQVSKRYLRLKDKKIENLPLIVESRITSLNTKQIIDSLKKILGKDLTDLAIKKRTVRSGKGKSRGRKYKSNAGLLMVVSKNEKIRTNAIDVKSVNALGVWDLAVGGVGRITLYTEQAIKELGEKLGDKR